MTTDLDLAGFHNHHPLPPREPCPGCVHGEILLPLWPIPLDLVVPLATLIIPDLALLSGAPCPPCMVGLYWVGCDVCPVLILLLGFLFLG